jgi:hypothetical protein
MDFRFSLRTPGMFVPQSLWLSVYDYPKYSEEFIEWAKVTFPQGHSATLDGKMVRSSRGAGNRGGWEFKPYWMVFHFERDSEAILFKMKWGHLAIQPAVKKKRDRFALAA